MLIQSLILLLFVVLSIPFEVKAGELIAHPSVPVDTMSTKELRSIYSMKRTRWPDNKPIIILTRSNRSKTHAKFCKEMLRVFPHQLQTGWDRLVYSGIMTPPLEVADEQAMLKRVASTPGAIGYVDKVPEGMDIQVKILEFRQD